VAGLRPDPLGSLKRSPGSLAGLTGKGGEGRGEELRLRETGKGRGKEEEGKEDEEGRGKEDDISTF